jgi:hypothetical protein
MASSYASTTYAAPAIPAPRYVSMLRIPSMTLPDAAVFTQLIGQYNRGLCSLPEMLDELNHRIESCGLATDRFIFTSDDFKVGSGYHIALEPYFHGTMPDRISFRVHFLDYR